MTGAGLGIRLGPRGGGRGRARPARSRRDPGRLRRGGARGARLGRRGLAVYLASGLVVDLAGASQHDSTQTSQLALSGFWGALGFAAIVVGLVRRTRVLRLGGVGVLALAVGKVFLVDLAHLESIWRVGSFLAIGLLLLAGAYAYQRVRPPSLHERREAG